jgi:hypothetical protein
MAPLVKRMELRIRVTSAMRDRPKRPVEMSGAKRSRRLTITASGVT